MFTWRPRIESDLPHTWLHARILQPPLGVLQHLTLSTRSGVDGRDRLEVRVESLDDEKGSSTQWRGRPRQSSPSLRDVPSDRQPMKIGHITRTPGALHGRPPVCWGQIWDAMPSSCPAFET